MSRSDSVTLPAVADKITRVREIVRKLTDEEYSILQSIIARLKSGTFERKSAAKAFSSQSNAKIALAVRQGRHADAERLRWQFYPERQARLHAEGKCGPNPNRNEVKTCQEASQLTSPTSSAAPTLDPEGAAK